MHVFEKLKQLIMSGRAEVFVDDECYELWALETQIEGAYEDMVGGDSDE